MTSHDIAQDARGDHQLSNSMETPASTNGTIVRPSGKDIETLEEVSLSIPGISTAGCTHQDASPFAKHTETENFYCLTMCEKAFQGISHTYDTKLVQWQLRRSGWTCVFAFYYIFPAGDSLQNISTTVGHEPVIDRLMQRCFQNGNQTIQAPNHLSASRHSLAIVR